MRFLLSEPTTSFTPRVISSKLKGIRGLGGTEGIVKILGILEEVGMVDFIDNRRSVRLREENAGVQRMKIFGSVCDMEGLVELLRPIARRIVLYGARAEGNAHTDSSFELFVVSEQADSVKQIVAGFPIGRTIETRVLGAHEYEEMPRKEPGFTQMVSRGVLLWDSGWAH
ncbi:MAG: hypothetical protein JNL01_03695 [Bdellovibrionales bacterium]|nr:hypothetical protein [Bdellovibrionales bacterium]